MGQFRMRSSSPPAVIINSPPPLFPVAVYSAFGLGMFALAGNNTMATDTTGELNIQLSMKIKAVILRLALCKNVIQC